jgi:ketosteroid isomerase-like protein
MSQENVEVVKRVLDAFNRRDVDAFAALTTPDFKWFPTVGGMVDRSSFRGREGIEQYFEDLRNTWDEIRVVGKDFRDLGDRVLLLGRMEGRGRGSGVPVDTPWSSVSDFCEGKISRSRHFLDYAEALRAAGLTK